MGVAEGKSATTPLNSVLLPKRTFFSFFQLWRLAILEPVGVQRPNVPHFKGLIMLYLDFEAQRRGSTFTFCHAQLKRPFYSIKWLGCGLIWIQLYPLSCNFLIHGQGFRAHTGLSDQISIQALVVQIQGLYTVKENEYYTFGRLWCKMAFFKWEWRKVKVLPQLLLKFY